MDVRELDVLASLFAVFVKVAGQVRTVLPAALAPLAALRMATSNMLPAVCPCMSGVEELIFRIGRFSLLPLIVASVLQLFRYALP
jgi:hypothetical protein